MGRLKFVIALVLFAFGQAALFGATWLLVDFGGDSASTVFGTRFPSWNRIIRHPAYTQFVNSDGDPTHDGITDASLACPVLEPYFGILGTSPIHFQRGQKIIATFYNRHESTQLLEVRMSLDDIDSPDGATSAAPWNTMYSEDDGEYSYIHGHAFKQLVFNITDASNVKCPEAFTTEGDHYCINFNLGKGESGWGWLVLTKVELSDEADTTPPQPPVNLTAENVTVSPEAPNSAVRLRWICPPDLPGPNGGFTGISRFRIYRNGHFYDMLNREWTKYYGDTLMWYDLGAAPESTYTYAVTAIDKAITGYNPTLANFATQKNGNESAPATVAITLPVFTSGQLIDPVKDLHYIGAFRMPWGFGYGGYGLTFYPGGNPECDTTIESPGSLYGYNWCEALDIGEVSIPKPVLSRRYAELDSGRFLKPFRDLWPRIYDGSAYPPGGGQHCASLTYSPGRNNVGEGLYYATFNGYCGSLSTPNHGYFNLDLTAATGAWYIGGLPGTPENVPFIFTGRLMTSASDEWADKYTGGRSLIAGLGWAISGHGWPSCGPALNAIAPWESGSLPANGSVLSCVELSRYGTTFQEDTWALGWNQGMGYDDLEWVDAGRKSCIILGTRTKGEDWYGGEDGYSTYLCDLDIPDTRGLTMIKGQHTTESRAVLYFYNPDDFGRVALGQWESWKPQPYAVLDIKDKLFSSASRDAGALSMAFDPGLRHLYVYEPSVEGVAGQEVVHVWKIDSTVYTPSHISAWNAMSDCRFDVRAAPNPFNPAVSITVTAEGAMVRPSQVTITIYDLTGRIVTDLSAQAVDGTCRWNASGMASGIYFVRAVSGSRQVTKKIILYR